MATQRIELISFNLCPFVQRSVITLLKKSIDFKITYIDLAIKPDWFLKLSPLGKVPVLCYGNEVLFESAVINEFLDEITPDSMMPADPLQKAKARGWIEFTSQLIANQFRLSVADNIVDYQKQREALFDKLARLEQEISEESFFNGENFSLIDSALAPVFTRFQVYERQFQKNLLNDFPKVQALANRYLAIKFVQDSVIENFEQVYADYLYSKKSLLAT